MAASPRAADLLVRRGAGGAYAGDTCHECAAARLRCRSVASSGDCPPTCAAIRRRCGDRAQLSSALSFWLQATLSLRALCTSSRCCARVPAPTVCHRVNSPCIATQRSFCRDCNLNRSSAWLVPAGDVDAQVGTSTASTLVRYVCAYVAQALFVASLPVFSERTA